MITIAKVPRPRPKYPLHGRVWMRPADIGARTGTPMKATLYVPPGQTQLVKITETWAGLTANGSCRVPAAAAGLLGCAAGLIDVLDLGPNHAAFSVFDFEGGEPNHGAMAEMTRLTGHQFGGDEDSTLLGPILILRNDA